jgi:subtilisin family serine protease
MRIRLGWYIQVAVLILGVCMDTVQAQGRPAQKNATADAPQRRMYTLPKLPTELATGPLDYLMPLAELLDHDMAADLRANRDAGKTTRRSMLAVRSDVAMLRGRWAEVRSYAASIRALQDQPAARAADLVVDEAVAQARQQGGSVAAQNRRIQDHLIRRYRAMPWADVQDTLKAARSEYELAGAPQLIPGLQAQANTTAKNSGMRVNANVLASIIHARVQLEVIGPHQSAVVAALEQVIGGHAKASAKQDVWTPRLATLPATAKASPVAIAVWDTGVDMKLFKPARSEGIAFDFSTGAKVPHLLRKLSDEKTQWAQQKKFMKGMMDLRAAVNSEDARKIKQRFTSLNAPELARFQEDMATASLYAHGTHVAGIAVAGNPFARVFTGSMHLSSSTAPAKPTPALSKAVALAYGQYVQAFKAAGVRVVNISWGDHPSHVEDALAHHGLGRDDAERRQMARRLFTSERDALKTALQSAPGILFVAAAGNHGNSDGNSVDAEEYIPAGFSLPNLITVGAVDASGSQTSFSAVGKTVAVHANGDAVESVVPGGDRVKFSGTSMAAPQVANLAAKLWALKPDLTVAQVKELILQGAEKTGRVNLIHPKKTLELAGFKSALE